MSSIELPIDAMTVIQAVLIIVVAIALERLFTRHWRGFSKRRELPPHVENGLVLTFRLLILLGSVIAVFRVGGLPTEWVLAFSALGGAAFGFASTRTIGNFLAGFYVLIVRPFRVNDYVRIGNTEGVVEEISLNYTKIVTPTNSTVLISNQRVLDQDITNFRDREVESGLYCYNFELGFDHTLSTDQLEKVFDEVIERYAENLPKKPGYALFRTTSFERRYAFYLYVESPTDVFTLQPMLVKDIVQAWDQAKARKSSSR